MICGKCNADAPNDARFCPQCGFSLSGEKTSPPKKRKPKTRGNGQGSVYKIGKTWAAAKVFGYEAGANGRSVPIRSVKRGFATKTEALNYLPNMEPPKKESKASKKRIEKDTTTVKQMYDLWLPTHQARGKSKSTIAGYASAISHFRDIWNYPFSVMGIDDWQDCLDDCGRGRRTKEVMKSLVSLLYKYAIPRYGTVNNINFGEYLFVTGEKGRRHPFNEDELEKIEKSVGKVEYADYIYCNCYLGYRPTEFITRTIHEHYNSTEQCIYGGIKTKAGQERVVTISPKIQPIIKQIIGDRTEGDIFCRHDGQPFTAEKYREVFAEALEKMGIESTDERKLTPYSCRHTFASLTDKITGNDNAKLELMGHTEVDMLRHYQHADLAALRSITDVI